MIFNGPLPLDRMRSSQKNYFIFSPLNGLSYMCVGEGMIILFAIKVNFPGWVVSVLGAIQFFGYLMLPLGRTVCARIGVAQSQATFWVARNVAAVVVAGAGLLAWFGNYWLGLFFLLAGAFFFYGFRAAGVVMSQPLVGTITDDANRGRVVGISSGLFFGAGAISLIVISLLLRWNSSVWTLTAVMLVGSFVGAGSSRFLRRIDENVRLRESAGHPLWSEIKVAMKSSTLWKLVWALFFGNLGIIALTPVSLLLIKRGYGISDTNALLFTLVQFLTATAVSFASGWISMAIGPRKMMMLGYGLMLTVSVLWVGVGSGPNIAVALLIFMLLGSGSILVCNGNTHYFLQSFDAEKQVSHSLLLQLVSGAGAGVVGMVFSGSLVKLASLIVGVENVIGALRLYFAVALLLLAPGYWIISRLVPLPIDKRRLDTPLWRLVGRII